MITMMVTMITMVIITMMVTMITMVMITMMVTTMMTQSNRYLTHTVLKLL